MKAKTISREKIDQIHKMLDEGKTLEQALKHEKWTKYEQSRV